MNPMITMIMTIAMRIVIIMFHMIIMFSICKIAVKKAVKLVGRQDGRCSVHLCPSVFALPTHV